MCAFGVVWCVLWDVKGTNKQWKQRSRSDVTSYLLIKPSYSLHCVKHLSFFGKQRQACKQRDEPSDRVLLPDVRTDTQHAPLLMAAALCNKSTHLQHGVHKQTAISWVFVPHQAQTSALQDQSIQHRLFLCGLEIYTALHKATTIPRSRPSHDNSCLLSESCSSIHIWSSLWQQFRSEQYCCSAIRLYCL